MPAWPLRPVRKPSSCFRVVLFDDGVADVRAVEAGEEDAGFAQAEAVRISLRVAWSAVAVSAMRGTFG
jgi:hypothetical protein